MTIEELAADLEPLALRLIATADGEMDPAVILAKSLICFIMAIGQQVSGSERDQLVTLLTLLLAPVALDAFPTKES